MKMKHVVSRTAKQYVSWFKSSGIWCRVRW